MFGSATCPASNHRDEWDLVILLRRQARLADQVLDVGGVEDRLPRRGTCQQLLEHLALEVAVARC
jgi:hypothetical protein